MTLMGDGVEPCPICEGDCIGFPDTPHRHDYPFIGGGVDRMAQEPEAFVKAPYRIDNPDGGPALYGLGDPIPYDRAVELGLAEPRAKHGPAEDRAKKPSEDRAKPKRTRKKAAPKAAE